MCEQLFRNNEFKLHSAITFVWLTSKGKLSAYFKFHQPEATNNNYENILQNKKLFNYSLSSAKRNQGRG